MALEFAKELLGDAYTGELEEKLEAKINELYAPKADLDAASARADGLQEQLNAANEAIGKFEGLDAEQVKAQIADYKQRAEAAEKDRDEKLAAAAFDAKIDKALADAKAHNPKLARGALDLDALRSSKNQDADIAAAIAAVQKKRRIPVRAGGSRNPRPHPAPGPLLCRARQSILPTKSPCARLRICPWTDRITHTHRKAR